MVSGRSANGELDACFRSLMLSIGSGRGQAEGGGAMPTLSGWKDLPIELLLRIMTIVGDDRMLVVASGVCTGWRDALGWGLTSLSLSRCQQNMNNLMISLAHKFTKLQVLTLRQNIPQLEDSAVEAAIARNCGQLQSLNLGWCEDVTDKGVTSLASGCPDLRALDLCGCVLITDESVVALATGCPHLRSLGLYYCQNITDRAMYSLANSRVKSKRRRWDTVRSSSSKEEVGLANLNISQCTALTPPAVQAVCDSFPALHTCPGRHSLIISGCLSLTSVHCACALHPHRAGRTMVPSHAY
uniref:F-box/LRR-repeat protein 15-like leucin rich repeat domain-containing protein n=1 Tax=Oryza meridionalis TaxID=40149 RepID=A0A0E0DRL7_9ORYZ